MQIGQKGLGMFIFFLSILATYHWYTAHIVNGMYVVELGVAIISFFIIAIGLMSEAIKIK